MHCDYPFDHVCKPSTVAVTVMRKGLSAGDVPAFVVVRATWEKGDESSVIRIRCIVVFLVVEGPIEAACM